MNNLFKNRLLLLAGALKSGKYQELTSSVMRSGNKFSVNGVACDLYKEMTDKGEWIGNEFHDTDGKWTSSLSDYCSRFFLDSIMYSHFNIAGQNLTSLCKQGTSFKDIANIIERYVNE